MTVEQTVPSTPGWSGAASTDLFKPTMMGSIQLSHRIAMAPLTRLRADPVTRVPGNDAAEYYTQRASSGGLIIAEANVVSEQGAGYKGAPGIFSREQIDAWKRINESVHAKGGIHFCQVFFIGRGASPDNVKRVVAMSNIPIDKESKTELHVLTEKEIEGIVEEFRHAAECVREAGFDGIELHSA
jgi:2,4-dienoyl-CoA reductase-like NADH-dependent reductase (Old Yellow Enzyme family)